MENMIENCRKELSHIKFEHFNLKKQIEMLHELKNNITKELSTLKLNKKDIIDYEMLPMSKSKLYTIKENDDEFDDYVKSLVDSMQILKFNVKLNHTNEEKTLSPLSKPTAITKFRLNLRLNDRFKKKVVRFKE